MSKLAASEGIDLAACAFRRAGVPEEAAQDAAEVLVRAEMMGIASHGLNRVKTYVDRINAGGIAPAAEVLITSPAPALRLINGQAGLGPAVATQALRAAMEAARACGIGAAFVTGGSHLGALAPYLWMAAEAGFATLATTNTAPMLAPAEGRGALIGNNPIGIGVPGPDGDHVLLDMALSVVARSKVRAAAEAGAPIPESWATDADGIPTRDAQAAMDGLMQAIGGAKGAQLALCLDLLASGLSGAAILSGVANAAKSPGTPQNLGQCFMLIDVRQLWSGSDHTDRIGAAAQLVSASEAIDPANPPRLPGARAIDAMRTAESEGLHLSPSLLAELKGLADR